MRSSCSVARSCFDPAPEKNCRALHVCCDMSWHALVATQDPCSVWALQNRSSGATVACRVAQMYSKGTIGQITLQSQALETPLQVCQNSPSTRSPATRFGITWTTSPESAASLGWMARPPKSRWSIKWSDTHIFKAEQEGAITWDAPTDTNSP